jgi:hypothetical protein
VRAAPGINQTKPGAPGVFQDCGHTDRVETKMKTPSVRLATNDDIRMSVAQARIPRSINVTSPNQIMDGMPVKTRFTSGASLKKATYGGLSVVLGICGHIAR